MIDILIVFSCLVAIGLSYGLMIRQRRRWILRLFEIKEISVVSLPGNENAQWECRPKRLLPLSIRCKVHYDEHIQKIFDEIYMDDWERERKGLLKRRD